MGSMWSQTNVCAQCMVIWLGAEMRVTEDQSHLSIQQRQSYQHSSETFLPCFQMPSSLTMKSLTHFIKFWLEFMGTFILCHVKVLLWFGSDPVISFLMGQFYCTHSLLAFAHSQSCHLWDSDYMKDLGFSEEFALTSAVIPPFSVPRYEHLW